MSKQYPECPLFNHENCKELHNRKVCAIVRKDKACLRNIPKVGKKARKRKETKSTAKRNKTSMDNLIKEIAKSTQIGL
jgi:hypothetical protein